MIKKLTISTMVLTTLTRTALATPMTYEEKYFTPKSYKIVEITEDGEKRRPKIAPVPAPMPTPAPQPAPGPASAPVPAPAPVPPPIPMPEPVPQDPPLTFGDVLQRVDGLMSLGVQIWELIKANAGVVNQKYEPSVSVIPDFDPANPTAKNVVNQMSHWSRPVTHMYRVSVQNWLNRDVMTLTFKVVYQYGGQYKGKGHYLNGIKIIATDLYTAFGYTTDATSELISISNVGTDDDPIAGANFQISYTVKAAKVVSKSIGFFVDGANKFEVL